MYIVAYDPETQKPLFTALENTDITAEFFEGKGYSCFLDETGNIINKYVSDNTLVDMVEMDLTYLKEPIATNTEYVIDGVPEETKVFLDNDLLGTVDDGNAEFLFEEVGTYDIRLVNDPVYIPISIKVLVE